MELAPRRPMVLSVQELADATLPIEAMVRSALTEAVKAVAQDQEQQMILAGGVCALLLRRYVQQAASPEQYLERAMRMILTP